MHESGHWQGLEAYLKTLVVRAIRLCLSQEGQQPSHGHFMVENALAWIESSISHFALSTVSKRTY